MSNASDANLEIVLNNQIHQIFGASVTRLREESVFKTVLEACLDHGTYVPSFCYHKELKIAGNCRMCLVEIEGIGKPVEACTTLVRDKMVVFTETPFVKKAQENIMESLLYLHPLDCPVCDQGGECDLQEQSLFFGSDRGRNTDLRRGVFDKNCGFFIKTVMTRCIHCTRCVRFSEELTEKAFFGTLSRGSSTEIAFFKQKPYSSEISANVIDLCPVGALTSKPHAFVSRPWEETSESLILNSLDPLGSSISLIFTVTGVSKIIPVVNHKLNKEWISDRSRFCYDSLISNRLKSILFLSLNFPFITKSFSLFKYTRISDFVLESSLNPFFFGKEYLFRSLGSFFFLSFLITDFRFFFSIFSLSKIYNLKNFFSGKFFSYFFNIFFFKSLDFRPDPENFVFLDSLQTYDSVLMSPFPIKKDFPVFFSYLNLFRKNNSLLVFFFGNLNGSYSAKNLNIGINFLSFFSFFRGSVFGLKKFFSFGFKKVLFLTQDYFSPNFFKNNLVSSFIFRYLGFYRNNYDDFYLESFFSFFSFPSSVQSNSLSELGYFPNINQIGRSADYFNFNFSYFYKKFLFLFAQKFNFFEDKYIFFKHNIFFLGDLPKTFFSSFFTSSFHFYGGSHGFNSTWSLLKPSLIFPLPSFLECSVSDSFLYFGESFKKSFLGKFPKDSLFLSELHFLNVLLKNSIFSGNLNLKSSSEFVSIGDSSKFFDDFKINLSSFFEDFRFVLNTMDVFLVGAFYGLNCVDSLFNDELFIKNSKNIIKSYSMFNEQPLVI